MSEDLNEMLQQVCRDRDLPYDVIFQALEKALIQAFKHNYSVPGDIGVQFAPNKIKVVSRRQVVDEVTNPDLEIALADARRIQPTITTGAVLSQDVTPRDFTRIAATMARQVLVQTINDAERDHEFGDFSAIIGEIRTGTVQRHEGRSIIVEMDRTEAFLPSSEQVPSEPYRFGDRIKVFILEAKRSSRGPQVIVSRTHFRLVSRLFELEVPEVHDGVVEIKAIAREPGARTKIAVTSRDERVDPVGSCVGHRGGRVQAIVNELYGERIDIIEWSSDVAKYVSAALQPARVTSVAPDPESKAAIVIVPDHQLSLAIGKHGQNVRLAARLTGWRVDIKSEQQVREAQAAEQQTIIRAAVSRQLSAKRYEPWGWAGHSHSPSHPVQCGPIPCVGESVFQAPWQA